MYQNQYKNLTDRQSKNNFNNSKQMANNKSYSNNNNQNKGQTQTKHSGAKHTKYFPKSGDNAGVEQYLTTGWRLSNGELISIKAVTTSKSKESEKGWFGSVAVVFTNTKTGATAFHWGTMQKSTGKVVVNEMAFVMNPKAKNNGYAGTFLKS